MSRNGPSVDSMRVFPIAAGCSGPEQDVAAKPWWILCLETIREVDKQVHNNSNEESGKRPKIYVLVATTNKWPKAEEGVMGYRGAVMD